MGGTLKIIMAVSSLIILASCASSDPEFTAYKDNTLFEGHGGVVRSVNGIELWTDGVRTGSLEFSVWLSLNREPSSDCPAC